MTSPIRVFHSLDEARGQFGPCALTIGNFDGVHLGHQRLFREVRHLATSNGWRSAVLTFDPHPACVVAPERAPRLLSTIEQRCRWMAQCGIDHVMVLPFTREVAALSPEDFVRQVLVDALNTKLVLVGDNFRFGCRQAGTTDTLRTLGERLGFEARPVGAVTMGESVISSSLIRKLLAEGKVARAARMLGRFYSLEGAIVKGHGIGSTKTVPTLNLDAAQDILPATGVYVTSTTDLATEQRWQSVTNIGFRPTFGGDRLTVETFLLSSLEGPPPDSIRLELTHRIRAERKFDTPEALRTQILRDVDRARKWHRRWQRWSVLPTTPTPPLY